MSAAAWREVVGIGGRLRALQNLLISDRRRIADLVVVPLVLVLSAAPILWFTRNYRVSPDGAQYLLEGWSIVSGQGYNQLGGTPETVRGPVFPAVLGALMWLFGRHVPTLALTVQLATLANSLLLYVLLRCVAGPWAGLLGAAMLGLMGYSTSFPNAFTVDSFLLTVYLLSVVVLLVAVRRGSLRLATASGVLAGLAVLTKETAVSNLMLGLFAALVLGWPASRAVLYYVGAAAVCFPWWFWVWQRTGEIYLVGQLSPAAIQTSLIALGVLSAAVAVAARTSVFHNLRRDDRCRRAAGWALAVGWSGGLLLLSRGARLSLSDDADAIAEYLSTDVLPQTPLWYLLPAAAAYTAFRAARNGGDWSLYLVLLLFQTPVSVVVLARQYSIRQWTLPEALLYGALAALVVAVVGGAVRAWRRREGWVRRTGATLVGAGLAASILAAGTLQIQALTTTNDRPAMRDPNNQTNEAVLRMHGWIQANIPADARIGSLWLYSAQIAFLDGDLDRWAPVKRMCIPQSEEARAAMCDRRTVNGPAWPPPTTTYWIEKSRQCRATALTVDGLLTQMEAQNQDYLLVTRETGYPATLAWVPQLLDTGSFRVVYSANLSRGPTLSRARGLVLLEPTGREPMLTPALMDATTFHNIVSCQLEVSGEGYAAALRSAFPNGVQIFGSGPVWRAARQQASEIFGDLSR